eukprot:TRINITY_DN13508_c0_g1_i1.p1 TRINITY_DN13508_c0_g1~~TRINITY_DN13508_c0_g1_i1.p1  ORF type:complete len:202 (-),score=30.49 TRINITY_DN13508_c0_g1_i1:238-843(-)
MWSYFYDHNHTYVACCQPEADVSTEEEEPCVEEEPPATDCAVTINGRWVGQGDTVIDMASEAECCAACVVGACQHWGYKPEKCHLYNRTDMEIASANTWTRDFESCTETKPGRYDDVFKTIRHVTQDECCHKCQLKSDEGCILWSYNPSTEKCLLHTEDNGNIRGKKHGFVHQVTGVLVRMVDTLCQKRMKEFVNISSADG